MKKDRRKMRFKKKIPIDERKMASLIIGKAFLMFNLNQKTQKMIEDRLEYAQLIQLTDFTVFKDDFHDYN